MMLDVKDDRGGTVIVPISLEYESYNGYKVNFVPSIYAKFNDKTGKPNNQWFLRQIEEGNLVYRNNKKSRDWSRTVRLPLPKNPAANHGRRRIFTESDLDKLKSLHPGMYQVEHNAPTSATPDASGNDVPRLFRGANLSTLIQETAHVFFLEMERLEREGLADERMLADLAALRDWTAAMDDSAALNMEQYLSLIHISSTGQ